MRVDETTEDEGSDIATLTIELKSEMHYGTVCKCKVNNNGGTMLYATGVKCKNGTIKVKNKIEKNEGDVILGLSNSSQKSLKTTARQWVKVIR